MHVIENSSDCSTPITWTVKFKKNVSNVHDQVFAILMGRIKQTFETRRLGRVRETGSPAHSTGGPAHSDGIAICLSSNA